MTRLVTVRSYPHGPRVWVAGQRLHHGATGAVLLAVARNRHRKLLGAAALLLCLHDRRDVLVWFKRESLPALSLDKTPHVA